MTIPAARTLDGCDAWVSMEKAVREAETEEVAVTLFERLRGFIEKRVAMLKDEGVAPDGTDQYGRVY